MANLPDPVIRYLRTLAAVEREAALADDTPAWLVGLLSAVDPADLADLIGDHCPSCGHSIRADLVGEFVEGVRRLDADDARAEDRRLIREMFRTFG